MMSEQQIKTEIKVLQQEIAIYDKMIENDTFNCGHYEAYDLLQGQLEAYSNILRKETPQKFSTWFKEFLKEWWMSKETTFIVGFVSGLFFSVFTLIIVAVMDFMGMIS